MASRPVSTTWPVSGTSTTAPSSACAAPLRPKPEASELRGAAAGQPEAPSVEGVGRQVDQPAAVARRAPVHRDARGERLGGRGEEAVPAALVATEGGDHDRFGGGVGAVADGVLDARDERRVRAGLDERPVAVGGRRPHGLVELHRLPDVAVPVVGVEGGGVDEIAGDGGEERGAASSAARCPRAPPAARPSMAST